MEEDSHKNLLMVLKLFQNKPHHLANFLFENKALSQDFLNKIKDSDKLSDMCKSGIKDNNLHFNSISEMKKYYNSLIDDLENLKRRKTKEELSIELNDKLNNSIKNEDYEEASRIRDYMKKNNINKNN